MSTTSRALTLLGLLQSRPVWTGPELAARMGVTERTVRRDVVRLRELGYAVDGSHGLDGGYRLIAGRAIPPLLLDDDEAVALTACLRMAAVQGSDEFGEPALRALTKLDQVLPPKVRAEVAALDQATLSLPTDRPQVDWRLLSRLAVAQRDRRLVRFDYTDAAGATSHRSVEPTRLLTQGALWYLYAFDLDRDDWRSFRLDRLSQLHVTTFGFPVRVAPDPRERIASMEQHQWPVTCVVRYHADHDDVVRRLPARYATVVGSTSRTTTVRSGAATATDLAWHLVWAARDLGCRMKVLEGDEMRRAVRELADDFAAVL